MAKIIFLIYLIVFYLNRKQQVKDFTMMNQTECIEALNKEITNLKEELEYYKESERALKNALRNMVAKVKTNS